NKDRVGAGQEAEDLQLGAHAIAPGTETDTGVREGNARRGDQADKLDRVDGRGLREGRAADRHQAVDRDALRRRIEGGQLRQQQKPIFLRLAHAKDSAATDGDAGVLDGPYGPQPVVIRPRGDDVWVLPPRRVEIVIVRGQPGLAQ